MEGAAVSRRVPGKARGWKIKIVCTMGHREIVVAAVRVNEGHRDPAARAAAPRSTVTSPDGRSVQDEPLDAWGDARLLVDDPMPGQAWGGTNRHTRKQAWRCLHPRCTPVLRLSPEMADGIIDGLVAAGASRVELSTLVASIGNGLEQ